MWSSENLLMIRDNGDSLFFLPFLLNLYMCFFLLRVYCLYRKSNLCALNQMDRCVI